MLLSLSHFLSTDCKPGQGGLLQMPILHCRYSDGQDPSSLLDLAHTAIPLLCIDKKRLYFLRCSAYDVSANLILKYITENRVGRRSFSFCKFVFYIQQNTTHESVQRNILQTHQCNKYPLLSAETKKGQYLTQSFQCPL